MNTTITNYINEFNATNKTTAESTAINWFQSFEYFRWNEDGSFTVKRGDDFTYDEEGLIWDLINEPTLNFEIAGEDGCAGNFDMYTQLYDHMTGKLYLVLYSTQEEYREMNEVTVYGRDVEDDELAEIYDYICEG